MSLKAQLSQQLITALEEWHEEEHSELPDGRSRHRYLLQLAADRLGMSRQRLAQLTAGTERASVPAMEELLEKIGYVAVVSVRRREPETAPPEAPSPQPA